MNIQDLERLSNLWTNVNNVLLIAAALVAVALGLIALFSSRTNTRLKEAQVSERQQIEEQFRLELTDKEEKLARLRLELEWSSKKTEEAKSIAAKAEQENIRLRTDLENATAEARNRQIQLTREQQLLAQEQQKSAGVLKSAAGAIISAQFNLQQMRSFIMPRRLIPGQNREKFLAALQSKPPASVEIVWQADAFIGEPKRFAEDIERALGEVHWVVKSVKGVLVANDPDSLNLEVASGIKILVDNPDNPTGGEQALLSAFIKAGFMADFFQNNISGDDVITLLIWMLPPDGGRVLRLLPGPNKE